jgi:hypothetical protein
MRQVFAPNDTCRFFLFIRDCRPGKPQREPGQKESGG